MSAVAVLLNFTNRLTFEETDPLMSLVKAEGALLYYDRITMVPFPSQIAERESHVRKQIVKLRNLLESRALSVEDRDEDIRLIILLDLTGGVYAPPEPERKCFPAQKAKIIRKTIKEVFGEDNPMLNRFEYAFVFLDDGMQNQSAKLYRKAALSGYGGEDWIQQKDACLNQVRDGLLGRESNPDEEAFLNDPTVKALYESFKKCFEVEVGKIADKLKEADCDVEFREDLYKRLKEVKTVAAFKDFDYDAEILNVVSECIGLSSSDFCQECAFFRIKVETNPIRQRILGEIYLKSLIQLLCTVNPNDYRYAFHPNAVNEPAKMFVSETVEDGWIDVQKLSLLKRYTEKLMLKVDEEKWKETDQVTFKLYTLTKPKKASVDAQFMNRRQELYEDFRRKSKVPFFFGKHWRDWDWYKRVLAKVAEIHQFESVSFRSLFTIPPRITDEDMDSTVETDTYAELRTRINAGMEEQNNLERITLEEGEEKRKLFDLDKLTGNLKRKMVTLGLFKWLFRIAFVSVLFITLCYAFPFAGNSSKPVWILVFLVVTVLMFVAGAAIAQSKLKTEISVVLDEVGDCQQNSAMNQYEGKLNQYVKIQNQADVLKKNLDEMKNKINDYTRHNRQVEIWASFYNGLDSKLDNVLNIVNVQTGQDVSSIQITHNNVVLEDFPAIPQVIANQFRQERVLIGEAAIENVICFVDNAHLIQQ